MRILFLHDNFPAQFGVWGQYLAEKGWDIWYGTQRKGVKVAGLSVFNYELHRSLTKNIHPYAASYERAILTGQGFARTGIKLKEDGFKPDIVVAHSGWGPGMFVKDIWPEAKYVGYFEWYYNSTAPDTEFLEPNNRPLDEILRARARNASITTDLVSCDAGICPTQFQKNQFPKLFDDKIAVLHDGIDTEMYQPLPGARLKLPDLDLTHVDELVTYVARGMEPYRGFPEFMSALEILLNKRPNAHAVIVGEDRVAYGKKLPGNDSYKKRMRETLELDWDRVHFTGLLPRPQYLEVLQASSVHTYLTIPFVLSWSMMESMSAGCSIVASDVDPVREIGDQGTDVLSLVDMKDATAVANAIINLLEDQDRAKAMGQAARNVITSNYAARDLFKRKAQWLEQLCNK